MKYETTINADTTRTETLDGTEYLVAPINLAQPMALNVPPSWDVNEAYVPENQLKESVPSWNGTPLTLNHPSASNGAGVSANIPEIKEKAVIGTVYNANYANDTLTAEAWLNIDKIESMGGQAEQALNQIRNGGSVEVSTGYRANKLPAGNYDGEHRNAVQGNLKPDHVAILPNAQGKCSIDAGCGAGATAVNSDCLLVTNADYKEADDPEQGEDSFSTGMIENYLDTARTPTYNETETQSWGEVDKTLESWASALDIDANTVADMSMDDKETVAQHTLLGDPEADSWGELRFFPVVNPDTGDLNRGALEAVISGRGETQESVPESAEDSAQSKARALLEEEFGMGENTEETVLAELAERVANYMDSGGNDPVWKIRQTCLTKLKLSLKSMALMPTTSPVRIRRHLNRFTTNSLKRTKTTLPTLARMRLSLKMRRPLKKRSKRSWTTSVRKLRRKRLHRIL